MKHIRSADNPGFKLLRELAGSARERRKRGQTLLDGAHLVDTWLGRGQRLVQLVVSESGRAQPEIAALMGRHGEGADVIVLSDALFARVSPVDTPSGILARIDIPPAPAARLAGGNCIVLDAVQDAGNLGTLLR
ncbi:MAG: RNA methyltransferase, partial [Rhodocyclaceae bacterium]|nr:RNA methyltransferase [Rhodocyclaceae bacterium]